MRHYEQQSGGVEVLPTKVITPDFFTKNLRKLKHITCRKLLGSEKVGAQN
jgi:hypothetical protein